MPNNTEILRSILSFYQVQAALSQGLTENLLKYIIALQTLDEIIQARENMLTSLKTKTLDIYSSLLDVFIESLDFEFSEVEFSNVELLIIGLLKQYYKDRLYG